MVWWAGLGRRTHRGMTRMSPNSVCTRYLGGWGPSRRSGTRALQSQHWSVTTTRYYDVDCSWCCRGHVTAFARRCIAGGRRRPRFHWSRCNPDATTAAPACDQSIGLATPHCPVTAFSCFPHRQHQLSIGNCPRGARGCVEAGCDGVIAQYGIRVDVGEP